MTSCARSIASVSTRRLNSDKDRASLDQRPRHRHVSFGASFRSGPDVEMVRVRAGAATLNRRPQLRPETPAPPVRSLRQANGAIGATGQDRAVGAGHGALRQAGAGPVDADRAPPAARGPPCSGLRRHACRRAAHWLRIAGLGRSGSGRADPARRQRPHGSEPSGIDWNEDAVRRYRYDA